MGEWFHKVPSATWCGENERTTATVGSIGLKQVSCDYLRHDTYFYCIQKCVRPKNIHGSYICDKNLQRKVTENPNQV